MSKSTQRTSERETGYVPTLPSPLQWLALPAMFSAVGQVYKDGSPNRYGYGGIRVVIWLPLQKESTRMYMLQRLDMPVSTGSTHQRIGPTEERTLIVQAGEPKGMDDDDGTRNGEMQKDGAILHLPKHGGA